MSMAVAGLLAACIVVFAPIAMAGWHLARNRVLFVSGMLFISLAMFVHLMPYTHFISGFFASIHSAWSSYEPLYEDSPQLAPKQCFKYLHEVHWDTNSSCTNQTMKEWTWKEHVSFVCKFQRLDRAGALTFLAGSHILVAGDSEARFYLVSILELLLEEVDTVKTKLFKYHSNYELVIDEHGIRIEFIWAPYIDNITSLLLHMQHNGTYPDVVIMGAGLWHMLHVTNTSEYGHSLQNLMDAVLMDFYLPSKQIAKPHLFWLNIPTLVTILLNTESKKEKLTNNLVAAYNREIDEMGLIYPIGPLLLLDLQEVTHKCGPCCTVDGMHYIDALYGSLVQVMLNTLITLGRQVEP